MFGLGFTEILVIGVLVLLATGSGRLPKVMEDLGKGVTAFKKGAGMAEDDGEDVPAAPKPAAKKKPAKKAAVPVKKTAKKPSKKPAKKA